MSKELESLERIENEYSIDEAVFYKEDFNQVRKSLKALEILKEHIKFDDRGIETYTDDFKNLVTKFLVRLESKDTGATFHIHLNTEEELKLLKEVLEWFLKLDHW